MTDQLPKPLAEKRDELISTDCLVPKPESIGYNTCLLSDHDIAYCACAIRSSFEACYQHLKPALDALKDTKCDDTCKLAVNCEIIHSAFCNVPDAKKVLKDLGLGGGDATVKWLEKSITAKPLSNKEGV